MGKGEGVGSVTRQATGGPAVLVAPAKLTVSLRIVGRRPDGYHELEAEMVSLDLADVLEVDPAGDGLEIVAGGHALGDGEDNLVRRALAAVGRRAGVRLHKRVPIGGGLGGGSSDAAAILRWAGCRDLELAARLGADVPFCVDGGRALVSGIGERVEPLEHVTRRFVLLLLPFGVDTGAVYRAWDALAGEGAPVARSSERVAGAHAEADDRSDCPGLNDLTAPALAVEPRLARWRDAFAEATGRVPVLAGSGSTWWVEGAPSELGLDGQPTLALGGEEGRLLAVGTVPARWAGDGVTEGG